METKHRFLQDYLTFWWTISFAPISPNKVVNYLCNAFCLRLPSETAINIKYTDLSINQIYLILSYIVHVVWAADLFPGIIQGKLSSKFSWPEVSPTWRLPAPNKMSLLEVYMWMCLLSNTYTPTNTHTHPVKNNMKRLGTEHFLQVLCRILSPKI